MEIKETETTSERANPRSHPSSRKVRRHQMDAPLSNTHTKKPKNKSVEKACAVIEERGRKRISPGRNRGKTRAGKHPKYNSNAGRGTERENAPRKSRSSFIRFSLFCSLLYRRRPFAFPNEITRNAEQTREEKNRLRRSALLFLRHPPPFFFRLLPSTFVFSDGGDHDSQHHCQLPSSVSHFPLGAFPMQFVPSPADNPIRFLTSFSRRDHSRHCSVTGITSTYLVPLYPFSTDSPPLPSYGASQTRPRAVPRLALAWLRRRALA